MRLHRHLVIHGRFFSIENNQKHLFIPKSYESMVQQRYMEAERTAFIVHPASYKNLYDYVNRFGKISNFITFNRNNKHYALIEYQNLTGLQKLLQSARHFPNEYRIPYSFGKSFYFHASMGQNLKKTFDFKQQIYDIDDRFLNDGDLQGCSNIDAQMKMLHDRFSLSDLDIRLKYFLASEVEAVAKCIFPDSRVYLFGSSVNGFGRFNGDADMMLKIEKDNTNQFGNLHNNTLYYMSRIRPEEPRQFSRHILELFGGILAHITPQIMNVRRILRARVPIIKFTHSPTEIECDICLNNDSAIEMSRILYKLMNIDPKFSTLVFTLRQWAKCNHVISTHPGPWLSNFMLTMLVLFRFQILEFPILPPLDKLKKIKYNDGNLSKNFTLEFLLLDFFNFYSTFTFEEKGISLNGKYIDKPDASAAIYIENPLEPELNICKNVSIKNLQIFKEACLSALHKLKTDDSCKTGILKILSLIDPAEDVLKDSSEFYSDIDENKDSRTTELSINQIP